MERFFRSLKTEWMPEHGYTSQGHAEADGPCRPPHDNTWWLDGPNGASTQVFHLASGRSFSAPSSWDDSVRRWAVDLVLTYR